MYRSELLGHIPEQSKSEYPPPHPGINIGLTLIFIGKANQTSWSAELSWSGAKYFIPSRLMFKSGKTCKNNDIFEIMKHFGNLEI